MFKRIPGLKLIWLVLILALVTVCTPNSEESKSVAKVDADISPEKFGIDGSKGVPIGLTQGSRAPAFSSRANDGSSFDLYSELQRGPVVILFYRGKWCPSCNRHMSHFNDSVNFILEKGAKVIAITPELRKNAGEFAMNTNTKFPIISDPTNTIMNAFGVSYSVTEKYETSIKSSKGVSISENNGSEEAKLPVPATYVIGQDGYIKYSHFDLNYRNRASVTNILNYLERD